MGAGITKKLVRSAVRTCSRPGYAEGAGRTNAGSMFRCVAEVASGLSYEHARKNMNRSEYAMVERAANRAAAAWKRQQNLPGGFSGARSRRRRKRR